MRVRKVLSFIIMLMGLFLSPIFVYGGAATTAPLYSQQIYSITEMDSPSPYHSTLLVRTGINTDEVWIHRADGGSDRGLLVSQGERQRVWQISLLREHDRNDTLIINANHSFVMDKHVVSQIYHVANEALSGTPTDYQASSSSDISIAPTLPFNQSDAEQQSNHAVVRYDTTVSNPEANNEPNIANNPTVWHGLDIIGDEIFAERTLQALAVVDQGPKWAYDYVVNYLKSINQQNFVKITGSGGHVSFRTRTFYVYSKTYMSDVMWYAGVLVHEAVHAKQYQDYLDVYGDSQPSGADFYATAADQMRIEMEALDVQIRFLEEAGAPKRIIDMARAYVGTVWWR